MKTTTTYHESYQPKQGFGARLLFYAFLLSLIGLSKAFAQAPANDDCASAIVLTPSATINYISGSTLNATQSIVGTCQGNDDDDVWYSFTALGYWHSVYVQSGTGFDAVVDVRTGTCSGSTNINCSDFTGVGGQEGLLLSGLDVGTTYFIRVYNSGVSSGTGNFQIAVKHGDLDPTAHFVSPTNGTIINNRCELSLCVLDTVGTENDIYIVDSNLNTYFGFQSYGLVGFSGCFTHHLSPVQTIPSGIQTFYLATGIASNIVDSVTLNIVNPIISLKNDLTFTQTPTTNGGYDFTVNGLSPAENYTLTLNNYQGGDTETLLVSGSTTGTISHQYGYNGDFYYSISVSVDCGNDSSSYSHYDTAFVNNSSCSSFVAIDYSSLSNPNCGSQLIGLYLGGSYGNLAANDSSQLVINWGDGNTETLQIQHDTSGFYNFSNFPHQYTLPGTYTFFATVHNANACYVDTLIQSVTIGSTTCGSLYGTIYSDINTNCALDNGTDNGLGNLLITATDASNNVYYAWTDFNGNYSFNTLPNGTYVVDIAYLNAGYSLTCSNVFPQTVTINNNSIVADCPVTCSGAFDAAITGISIWSALYPGQPEMILPHVGLLNGACNTTVTAGQVKIVLDACTQYTGPSTYSGAGAPDAIITAATGDTLVWNVADINNIGNFSYYDYAINILMCTTAQVGDSACITMIVEPLTGDADPTNNTYTRCFEIGVSYDPNNKEVQPTGVETAGFIPADQPLLTYTLNFQNTGTAKAFNVYVMDTISTNLDINSIEILSASHKLQVYSLENRAVKFMFAGILLPDSTHDEPNSHGYVTFKIKLNTGLTPGTEIENTGHIYFDYNEPVVTNTTLNTIEFPSSVQTLGKSSVVKVFPNPAKESVTVVSTSNSAGQITITDLLGKTVKEVTTTNEKTVVNTADLQSGVYFIKLTQNNVSKTEKIMIAK